MNMFKEKRQGKPFRRFNGPKRENDQQKPKGEFFFSAENTTSNETSPSNNYNSRGFGGFGENRGRTGDSHFGRSRSNKRNKKQKMPKVLDWKLFVKKARPVEETIYIPTCKYSEMNLHEKLLKAIEEKGYEYPTEIQDKTIQQAREGRDILGIANTGTGKTGAFLIPVIDRLLTQKPEFQTLIISPTRELATQIEEEFISLGRNLRLWSACLTGGTSIKRNLARLAMKNHAIIGTPGRIIDMVERGALDLSKFEVLILDEFDRMLDMGFIDDIKFLRAKMTAVKQTMLFSATVDKKLKPLIDEMVANPHEVMISTGHQSSERVEQDVVKVARGENKFEKLLELLRKPDFHKVLIFAETKRMVDDLHFDLRKAGIESDLIHGDKSQKSRDVALDKFKKGRVDILIATDVAARGLDIKGVSHVINYEVPRDYDSYIHRIGRTGRAGKSGFAFTFVEA